MWLQLLLDTYANTRTVHIMLYIMPQELKIILYSEVPWSCSQRQKKKRKQEERMQKETDERTTVAK